MANQTSKNSDPRKFGMDDDPFKLDPRFAPLAGYNASPALNLNKSAEELDAEPDPALEAWGSQLPREVLAGNRAKNELKQFLDDVSLEDLEDAFAKGGMPKEDADKLYVEIQGRREEEAAQRFVELHPEYVVDERNSERLLNFLDAHNLPVTEENLDEAYRALLAGNHLVVPIDQIKELDDQELLHVARLATGGDISGAMWLYLKLSLPAMPMNEIQMIVPYDPKYSVLVKECLYYLFRITTLDYSHDESFVTYLHEFMNDLPWSLERIRAAWQKFKQEAVLAPQREADHGLPTSEDIENLSEEQQEKLLKETKRLRAQQLARRSYSE